MRAVADPHQMSCSWLQREKLNRQWRYAVTFRLFLLLILFSLLAFGTASSAQAGGETLAFAVVSEAPKDKARVSAKVLVQ